MQKDEMNVTSETNKTSALMQLIKRQSENSLLLYAYKLILSEICSY